MTRQRKVVIILVVAAAGVALLFFHYKERNTYACADCQSRRHVFQWRLGSWMGWSVPLTGEWERIDESQIHRDYFDASHVHRWEFMQGSPYQFFGTRWSGCALGSGGRMNDFCQWYELSDDFREKVRSKIDAGELTADEVRRIAALPRRGEPDDDAETARLRTLGERLTGEN